MFGFSSPLLDDWISDLNFWRRHEPKVVKEALADLKRYHKYWGVHTAFQTWISFLKTLWENLGQLWRDPDAEESRVLTFLTFDQQSTFDCCRSEKPRQVILATRVLTISASYIWDEYSKVSSLCWKHGHTCFYSLLTSRILCVSLNKVNFLWILGISEVHKTWDTSDHCHFGP